MFDVVCVTVAFGYALDLVLLLLLALGFFVVTGAIDVTVVSVIMLLLWVCGLGVTVASNVTDVWCYCCYRCDV